MVLLNVPNEIFITLMVCVFFIMLFLMFDYRREMMYYKDKYHREWNKNVRLTSEMEILQANLKKEKED